MKGATIRLVWAALPVVLSAVLAHGQTVEVRVMTRNLYIGADVSQLLAVRSLFDVPQGVSRLWRQIQAAEFPERARLVAAEIATFRPHVIGLQEVALIAVQSPGDFLTGNRQPATEVALDYLEILLAELAERGLEYRAVATVENQAVEAPNVELDDIRVVDREVLLARADVQVSDPQAHNYRARLTASLGSVSLDLPRGWAGADVTVGGGSFRVVSTHLETAASESIQVAQGEELAARAPPPTATSWTGATAMPGRRPTPASPGTPAARRPTYGTRRPPSAGASTTSWSAAAWSAWRRPCWGAIPCSARRRDGGPPTTAAWWPRWSWGCPQPWPPPTDRPYPRPGSPRAGPTRSAARPCSTLPCRPARR
ncbi:MAG: hypothetical protein AB1505_01680 [Candidatus Latescibacterota bacterium]